VHRCPGKKFLSFALLFFSSILGVKSISAQDTGAPAITTQPTNQTVTVGQSATFTAVVSSGPCRSLWFINGQGYYGPFSSTISYTITNTTLAMNGWTVAVSLYDCGSMGANLGNSQTAILTVTSGAQQQKSPAAPTIATQPANQTVAVGQPATFSVAANGTAPLSYQWQKNGSNIIGATSSSYTTPATATTDNGSKFQVVVNNSAGSLASNAATLTVNAGGAPAITQQPQSQAVQVGQPATFTAVVSNGPCHSFWYINGAGSYGPVASTISYTIANATLAMNGWTVAADLYDCGSAAANLGNSQTAILTVTSTTGTPAIATQPANVTVAAAQTATFAVAASGRAPLSYQWQKNGANISGATSASYTTPATTSTDNASTFKVVVSNPVGSVTSSAATLTVNTASLAVSITSPTNGATASGTITVSGTASDSLAVTLVQLSVDSGSFSNASGTNNWSFNLGTTSLRNATHTLTAKATDSSGNTATSNPVSITVNNSSGGRTSTVDWTTAYQTITGFGAATAFQCHSQDANGECNGNGNGNPWTKQELNLLYDQNLGIGLSLIRFKIEENGSFPYNTNILNAIAKGAQAWGAPWSPPATMKTNGSIKNGGSLEAASYQAWATQLVNYVSALKNTYGIPVYAISVQNEPDFVASYESATYSAEQFHDFVLNNLCPTLQSVGLGNVKIMMSEESHWQFDLTTTTKNDAAANACVGIYAAHGYNSPASAFAVSPGQELWETEDSDLGAQDTSAGNGLYWAQKLHDFLTIANLNAWHYWWAVDSDDSTGQGLLNDAGGTLVIPARFYMIGQYTKFIRPGYVRIDATVSPVANTYISAYKNPASSGHVVIVAINQGSGNANVTFQFSGFTAPSVTPYVSNGTLTLTQQPVISSTGGSFSYTLLPFSVTTFVTP
jgi:glucuronoarabinoxylan endo-1,4-beta-xylanase